MLGECAGIDFVDGAVATAEECGRAGGRRGDRQECSQTAALGYKEGDAVGEDELYNFSVVSVDVVSSVFGPYGKGGRGWEWCVCMLDGKRHRLFHGGMCRGHCHVCV